MKWYRLYKESDEQANLKKLLKLNGVTKLPSGTEFKLDRVSWSKDGGYAGQKTLEKICSQLEDAGWKRGKWRTGGIPDGSVVTNSNAYTSPDGQIMMTYSEHYGATAHDNYYGFTFKLAESPVNESSRFGFNVGDKVELKVGKEPNRFGGWEKIEAGTQGEIVAIDKPMPGAIKVKLDDGTVVTMGERQLKLAGTDNEPWKTLAANRPPEPKRDVRPERPEDYYMRPMSYGSPRFTGD